MIGGGDQDYKLKFVEEVKTNEDALGSMFEMCQ